MRQMGPLVYEWSVYQSDRRLNANGHFVQRQRGEPGVLVDPVPFGEGDEAHVRDLGGAAAVVVTQPDRAAEAIRCREVFGGRLLARRGIDALESADAFGAGDELPAGLRVVAAPAAASAGETSVVALYHVPSGCGILGGALAGAPAGELSLLLDGGEVDESLAAAMVREVRALLSQPLRRVLVSEGEAVLRDTERALQNLVFRHDPAAFLLRPDELFWQPPREMGSRFSRRSAECSRLLGLRTLDFEVTTVPPGKRSTLMHGHPGYEELFVILEGEGEVQTERGTFAIRAGDALGFPARHHVAHGIRNTGTVELRMLSFGAHPPPDEAAGIAEYPESNKQMQWLGPGKIRRFYLPDKLDVDYWEGERLD